MTQEEKGRLEKELTEKFGSKVTLNFKKFDTDYSNDPFFVKKLEEAKKIASIIKNPEIFFSKKGALQTS